MWIAQERDGCYCRVSLRAVYLKEDARVEPRKGDKARLFCEPQAYYREHHLEEGDHIDGGEPVDGERQQVNPEQARRAAGQPGASIGMPP